MKNVLVVFILLFGMSGAFAKDKIKIRFKKGTVMVNKVAYAKYELAAGKYFISTLAGEEFVSVKPMEYGTGRYFENTGKEIMHHYCSVHFFKSDIPEFEVDANMHGVIELFVKRKVVENDIFSKENAIEFKTRYEEQVSEKVFLTK